MIRQAGCFMIGWAIESGSTEVLRRAGKPTSLGRTHETIAASCRLGIANWGYFQIGLPAETLTTIQETIAFSRRLPLDQALFRVATPYPGTPFYAEALEHGWLRFERWEDYGARTVLNTHIFPLNSWTTGPDARLALRRRGPARCGRF